MITMAAANTKAASHIGNELEKFIINRDQVIDIRVKGREQVLGIE